MKRGGGRKGQGLMACLQKGGNTMKATSGYSEALVGQQAYGNKARNKGGNNRIVVAS